MKYTDSDIYHCPISVELLLTNDIVQGKSEKNILRRFLFFATRKCKSDQFVHIGLLCSILAVVCFSVD